MKRVLDPGHAYELLTLDGNYSQTLYFVKRCDLENPERFPGNKNSYPGTTIQSVMRCLIDRIEYLQKQIPHANNITIKERLLECIWLLEERAAERHGKTLILKQDQMATLPMCDHCGHLVCDKLK